MESSTVGDNPIASDFSSYLFEFASDGVLLLDLKGYIQRVNPTMCRWLGYNADELTGLHQGKFYPTEFTAEVPGRVERIKAHGHAIFECACICRDGRVMPVEINSRIVEIGSSKYYLSVARDITERKRLEAEIAAVRRVKDDRNLLFQAMLDNAPIGIWMLGVDHRIKFINHTFCNAVGISEPEFRAANHYSEVLPPAVSANCIKSDRECFQQVEGVHLSQEWLPFVDGQDHLLEITKAKIFDPEGKIIGLIGLANDITERKLAENEIREQQQSLRELAAKSSEVREEERKFIAREVHDELGQILSALRMDVSLMRIQFGAQEPLLMSKIQDVLVLVDKGIQGVREVTSRLRPSALNMGIVPALNWLCEEFPGRTGTACRLRVLEEPVGLDDKIVVAIFRIVQESLANVARHAGADSVDITIRECGKDFCLEVRDDGKGFDTTLTPPHKSFGLLGMKERALAVSGRLEVVSAPSKGTVIHLHIPNIKTVDESP